MIDPNTNEIRYIGQTLQTLHRRLVKHHSDCERMTTHVNCWLKKLKSAGQRAIIQLIEECSIELVDEREIYYISKYKADGYNLTNISEGGQKNRIISQETKDKISKTLTGKVQSKETKEKRRKSLLKTWESPELRQLKRDQTNYLISIGKITGNKGKSSKKKGKPFAGDKDKLSKSLKKHYSDVKIRNKVAITNGQKPFLVYKGIVLLRANRFRKDSVVEKGEFVMEHININEACRQLGVKYPINARKCLRGKRNIVEGYIFIYK